MLNGYRGVVEAIEESGKVRVAWQQAGDEDEQGQPRTRQATLGGDFIAAGGLSLGYAMTGHKAEGMTVTADWAIPDGSHQGGTVLVHAAGMDEPGLHVATSRHRDKVMLFAGRDQLESAADTYELGTPVSEQERQQRVIAALAEHARNRTGTGNDRPVHDDLGRSPQPQVRPERQRDPAAAWQAL